MKVLNFGSLNYDYVYSVSHIAAKNETLSSSDMEVRLGGKGLNQSIALSRAGCQVYHAGCVGTDGERLLCACKENGINADFIRIVDGKSGHAIIQVDPCGDNCIIVYGGANQKNSEECVREILSHFSAGDYVLLQNEVNQIDRIINLASEKGLKIVLNPSPLDEKVKNCDLSKISIFLLNELEGAQLVGETEPEQILEGLKRAYPQTEIVLTLGRQGSMYASWREECRCDSFLVDTVDTTAAGDTFTGYFLGARFQGLEIKECLRRASAAAAIAVTREGAASSIPMWEEVKAFLEK